MAVHCTAVRHLHITHTYRAQQINFKYQMACAWNWGRLCIDLKSQIFHLRLIKYSDITSRIDSTFRYRMVCAWSWDWS